MPDIKYSWDFARWLSSEESACSTGDAGDAGSITGLG